MARARRLFAFIVGAVAVSACSLVDLSGFSGGAPVSPGDERENGDARSVADGAASDAPSGEAGVIAPGCTRAGPRRGQTAVSDGVGVPWSAPERALNADGMSASASLDGESSARLVVSSFGFTIPPGASVVGIELTIVRTASDRDEVFDTFVGLVRGGVSGGASRAAKRSWQPSFEQVTYGGAADTFDEMLKGADVNLAGFGVGLIAVHTGTTEELARVDDVSVTITYCE